MFPVLIAGAGLVLVLLILGFGFVRLSRIQERRSERQEEILRSLPPLAHRIRGEAEDNRRSGCRRILLCVFAAVTGIWLVAQFVFGLPFNQAGNEALRLSWPAFWVIIGLCSLAALVSNWRSCRGCGRVLIQLPRTDDERRGSGVGFLLLGIQTPFAWSEYTSGRVEAAAAILFSAVCSSLYFGVSFRRGVAFTETGITVAGRHYPWSIVTEWEWSSDKRTLAIAVATDAGPGCLSAWLEDDPAAHQEIEQLLRESVSLTHS